jgi:hypothetical protein
MAAFNYSGFARIVWSNWPDTRQYVHFDAEDGILMVWPENNKEGEVYEYIGTMADHPAEHIYFNQ